MISAVREAESRRCGILLWDNLALLNCIEMRSNYGSVIACRSWPCKEEEHDLFGFSCRGGDPWRWHLRCKVAISELELRTCASRATLALQSCDLTAE